MAIDQAALTKTRERLVHARRRYEDLGRQFGNSDDPEIQTLREVWRKIYLDRLITYRTAYFNSGGKPSPDRELPPHVTHILGSDGIKKIIVSRQ